jgi:DNA polymerase
MPDMAADTVLEFLKGDLPADARRFLEIRQSLAKSSTAKFEAAKHMACSDGRMRGFAMYHGASTGRYTGKGIQLQNLPRGVFDMSFKPSEEAFWYAGELVRLGSLDALLLEFGDPMPILSSVIRPLLLAAPGHELLAADFSAIEGRGLAWLAGEQWVLDAYAAYDRHEGPDMYMVTAGKILGKPADQITKAERKSPGKIADLACGYFGGPGAIEKFNGQCPEEERPKWTVEWMRRELKENAAAVESIENLLAQGYALDTSGAIALAKQGWPIPSDYEIFELWARDVVTKWRGKRVLVLGRARTVSRNVSI